MGYFPHTILNYLMLILNLVLIVKLDLMKVWKRLLRTTRTNNQLASQPKPSKVKTPGGQPMGMEPSEVEPSEVNSSRNKLRRKFQRKLQWNLQQKQVPAETNITLEHMVDFLGTGNFPHTILELMGLVIPFTSLYQVTF